MATLTRFIPKPKLTWKLIKSELFGKKDDQDDDLNPPEFEDWQAEASSSSDEESSDEEKEGKLAARHRNTESLKVATSSKKPRGYRIGPGGKPN